MISNRCARKSLVTNCNSIISKNYLRFLVDSNGRISKLCADKGYIGQALFENLFINDIQLVTKVKNNMK